MTRHREKFSVAAGPHRAKVMFRWASVAARDHFCHNGGPAGILKMVMGRCRA